MSGTLSKDIRVFRLITLSALLPIVALLLPPGCSSPQNPYTDPDNVTIEIKDLADDTAAAYHAGSDTLRVAVVIGLDILVDSVVLDFDEGEGSVFTYTADAVSDTITAAYLFTSGGEKTVTASAYISSQATPSTVSYVLQVETIQEPPQIGVQNPALERDSCALKGDAAGIAGRAYSDAGLDTLMVTVNGTPVAPLGMTDWVVAASAFEPGVWSTVAVTAVDNNGVDTTKTFYVYRMPELSAPKALAAETVDGSSLALSWKACAGCDRYIVERSDTTAQGPFAVASDSLGDTTYTDTGLSSGTRYWYRVRGYYIAPGGLAISDTTGFSSVDSARTAIAFQKTFGDAADDFGRRVHATGDSAYIALGSTYSYGVGYAYPYLLRLDATGDTVWTTTLGSASERIANGLCPSPDGGYAVGWTFNCVGAAILPCPFPQIALTDSSGSEQWTKAYGYAETFWEASLEGLSCSDNGYYAVGTFTFEQDPENMIVFHTSPGGDSLWVYTGNGTAETIHLGTDVSAIADGGCYATGYSSITAWVGGPVPPDKILCIRLSESGDTVWSRSLGGNRYAHGHAIETTADGGCVVAGESAIVGADTGMHIVKIDADGNTEWSTIAGGKAWDVAYGIRQTNDGGYIVTGATRSKTAGEKDVLLVRLDASGGEVWSTRFGGTEDDIGYDVDQARDGGYIVVGETESYGAGKKDLYVIKTDSHGNGGLPPQ